MIAMNIKQALQDAGCSGEFIERFINSSCSPEKMSMLTMHRSALLNQLHEYQQKLQRLDFIMHLMRQKEN